MLDRFHENVVWSQRDNFVSVPTDCPQRDERLGWTGDAQAFAADGLHALRRAGVLGILAARPRPRPGRRARASRPSCPMSCSTARPRFGRAGWADAATIVPWAVYESYGDAARPARPARTACGARGLACARRLGPDGLLAASGMQFGDWLDPDAPIDRPWEAKADSHVPRQRLPRPQRPARRGRRGPRRRGRLGRR